MDLECDEDSECFLCALEEELLNAERKPTFWFYAPFTLNWA